MNNSISISDYVDTEFGDEIYPFFGRSNIIQGVGKKKIYIFLIARVMHNY